MAELDNKSLAFDFITIRKWFNRAVHNLRSTQTPRVSVCHKHGLTLSLLQVSSILSETFHIHSITKIIRKILSLLSVEEFHVCPFNATSENHTQSNFLHSYYRRHRFPLWAGVVEYAHRILCVS